MTKKTLKKIMTGLFLILAFGFLAYQRVHKPRVFILHSYHASMPWVTRLNQGIHQIFANKPYISLRYFYMDSKRKHYKSYQRRIKNSAIQAIEAWQPDIIIALDNDAQMLINKEKHRLKDIKVILAGVTDDRRWDEYRNNPHLTAITEAIPVNAVREVLSLIFRQKRRIYYLSDNSTASRSLEENMLKQNWGSFELIEHKRVSTLTEWKNAVHEAEQTADILLISVYQSIHDGHALVESSDLIQWTVNNSKIPSVGVYESFMLDGGMIAIAISAIEQGYSAAWLALQSIEKHMAIKDMPMLRGKSFSLFINKSKLRKYFPDARVPVILDTFSKSDSPLSELPPMQE